MITGNQLLKMFVSAEDSCYFSHYTKCDNNRECYASYEKCDDSNDCGDGTDERNCGKYIFNPSRIRCDAASHLRAYLNRTYGCITHASVCSRQA